MRVDKINSISFESKTPKKRYITEDMRIAIESILLKMNSDIRKVQDGDYIKTTINTKLRFGKDVIFEDERRLKNKIPFEKQMQGFSTLKMGNTVLYIDNENKEIIDYEKTVLKPLFMVLRKAGKILSSIRTNFNLPQSVKKEYITINDLTPDGHKKMKQYVLQIEKQRLEKIIKEIEESSK